MSYVRGQERFVTEEMLARVRDGLLIGLHWDGSTLAPGQLPWGATQPLVFIEAPPDPVLAGGKVDRIAPNTIAVSEGSLPPDEELEIGGKLVESLYTYFIDIYGEDRGIARTIALDVRALLTDRVQGYRSVIPLRDWSAAGKPTLPGHLLRIEDVEVSYPAVGEVGKLHWAVVKATVRHEHVGGY